ncbi:PAS domain S-box protein [Natrialbaceae archaeon AArc-T1-2]|uniref:PAS domain S-box protein n=1 Tax=Natrialbaceae archaeon AArc-T1-2 TaxID=3053904 RepID=UPI00255ADD6F|nr:PAS domain S-box protein [Natrialbaceae archaeon AArc-T1-2]WIV68373.1 PAS domain S-box protein [Natrialbaceae archaeon AArc-T1-2]
MNDRSVSGGSLSSSARHRYRTLLETVDDGVVRLDDDGHVVEANGAFLDLVGADRDAICGEPVATVLAEGENALTDAIARFRDDPDDVYTTDRSLRTTDGETRRCEWRLSALEATDSDSGGVLAVVSERDDHDRYGLQYAASRAIAAASSLSEGLEGVLGAVCEETDWEYGEAWLPEGSETIGRAPVSWLESDRFEPFDEASTGARFDRGEGLPGRVWASGKPEWIADVSTVDDVVRAEIAESVGLTAVLGVPVVDDGDVTAVLVFGASERRAPDDRLIEHVVSVGAELGGLIARIQSEAVLERQRDGLRRELDDVFDRVTDAFYALDDEWRFTYLNERAEALLGRSETELLGKNIWMEYPNAERRDRFERAMESQQPVTYEEYSETIDAWFEVRIYPSESGLSVYFRDVSDREKREQALVEPEQRYRTLVEHFPDGVVILFDRDLRYTLVEGRKFDELEIDPETMHGERPRDLFQPRVADALEEHFRAALDGEKNAFELTLEGYEFELRTVPVTDENGEAFAGMAVAQDVTDRTERERELERYETIVETMTDGVFVLDEDDRTVTVNDALVELSGYSREELLGSHISLISGEAVARKARSLTDDLVDEDREYATIDASARRPDGERVPAESRFTPLTDEHGEYRGRVGVVRDISERKERERSLERRREQLEALNELNGVVREITDAILERSTREEIEEVVCERLAAADSYAFAWIGGLDPGTETIELRTEAGVEGYLDGVTISTDPDDDRCTGPAGNAVRSREIRVVRDGQDEGWCDRAAAFGFQSAAAIPIVHGGTLYGVLNVYADRPHAFADDERTVVGGLGEIVGHAIAAAERKRALMSDDVVELEIRIEDVFDPVDATDATDASIDLERTVPIGDGEYVQYGTTTADGLDVLERLCATRSSWTDVTVVSEEFGEIWFELRLSEPPVISTVASHGGSVGAATIEDAALYLTVRLPQDGDVRRVIDAVKAVHPSATVLAHRQRSHSNEPSARLGRAWTDALTDRQRTALEVAYYSGFFEWPRENSGEDVADTLGVSSPTFHQHVRRAEKELFAALLDEDKERTD